MNENSAISSWNLRLGRGTGEERFQFVLKFNQKLGSAYALSGASFRWGRESTDNSFERVLFSKRVALLEESDAIVRRIRIPRERICEFKIREFAVENR